MGLLESVLRLILPPSNIRSSNSPLLRRHGKSVFLNGEASPVKQSPSGFKYSGAHSRAQHLSAFCLWAYQHPGDVPGAAPAQVQ